MGLYHGGTDGGLREMFSGLYHPMPDPYDLDFLESKYKFQDSSGLTDIKTEVIEEIEYLSKPEDVLIKKMFGQCSSLKELVWQKCLNHVKEIFYKNATAKGLKVINYHHLVTARVI